MPPAFSIIVPVYNVAPYLRACLDSVLAQTCPDWECVCVDDGSTDGGGAILDAYAARDARLRVLHQPNGGVSAARNAALDAASGDWLAFLDADDVWHPRLLEACAAAARRHPSADVIAFRHAAFDETATCAWPPLPVPPPDAVIDLSCTVARAHMGFNFWSRVFRRAPVADLRFQPYSMGEDLLYMTEAFPRLRGMVSLDAVLYGYRRRAASAMNSGRSARKVRDSLHSRAAALAACGRAPGRFARDVWKHECNALAEASACDIRACPANERLALEDDWRRLMRTAAAVPGLPAAQRARMRLAAAARSRLLTSVLCVLPHLLKRRIYGRRVRKEA